MSKRNQHGSDRPDHHLRYRLFDAVQVYSVKGTEKYLMIVEAIGDYSLIPYRPALLTLRP